jgi:type VI secretion system protein
VLLKYEPRLKSINVILLDQDIPGELRYAIDAELKGIGLVRYGTEFMPEGRVLIRHLKQQNYLDTKAHMQGSLSDENHRDSMSAKARFLKTAGAASPQSRV